MSQVYTCTRLLCLRIPSSLTNISTRAATHLACSQTTGPSLSQYVPVFSAEIPTVCFKSLAVKPYRTLANTTLSASHQNVSTQSRNRFTGADYKHTNSIGTSSSEHGRRQNSETALPFEEETFKFVYRFPYILPAKILSRFKIYQTAATVLLLIPASMTYFSGGMETEMYAGLFGVSGIAGVMLYVMSSYFRRIIGIIGINEAGTTVKVSHLTFWGKRRDLHFPIKDIIPLSDMDANINDAYVKFKTYESDHDLYLFLRFGKIVDAEKFVAIFGKVK